MSPEQARRQPQLVYMPVESTNTASEALRQAAPQGYDPQAPTYVMRVPLHRMEDRLNMLGVVAAADSFNARRIFVVVPDRDGFVRPTRELVNETRRRYGQQLNATIQQVLLPAGQFLGAREVNDVRVDDFSYRVPDQTPRWDRNERTTEATMRIPGGAAMLTSEIPSTQELPVFGTDMKDITQQTRVRIWQRCFYENVRSMQQTFSWGISELEAATNSIHENPTEYAEFNRRHQVDHQLDRRFISPERANDALLDVTRQRDQARLFRDRVRRTFRVLHPYGRSYPYDLTTPEGREALHRSERANLLVERINMFDAARQTVLNGTVPPFDPTDLQLKELGTCIDIARASMADSTPILKLSEIYRRLSGAGIHSAYILFLIEEGHFDAKGRNDLSRTARNQNDFIQRFNAIVNASPSTAALVRPDVMTTMSIEHLAVIADRLGVELTNGEITADRAGVVKKIQNALDLRMGREDVGQAKPMRDIITRLATLDEAIRLEESGSLNTNVISAEQRQTIEDAIAASQTPGPIQRRLRTVRTILSTSLRPYQVEFLIRSNLLGPNICDRARNQEMGRVQSIAPLERVYVPGGLDTNLTTAQVIKVAQDLRLDTRLGIDIAASSTDQLKQAIDRDVTARLRGR